VKILWISRHAPKPEHRDWLSDLLGAPIEVTTYRATVTGGYDALAGIVDMYQPERVVASLPIDLQQDMLGVLAERRMPLLIKPVYHHTRSDDGTPMVWTLMHFEEILSMDVERRVLTRKEKQDV
jgi:hypothetical protein